MSGAGAGEPPAVGAAAPAMSGHVSPLCQTFGWVSSREPVHENRHGSSSEPVAGAGGQQPPRRSGAGVGEPPAVGAVVPAKCGRVAPSFQTLDRVS